MKHKQTEEDELLQGLREAEAEIFLQRFPSRGKGVWFDTLTEQALLAVVLFSLSSSTTRSFQMIVITTTMEGNSWNGNTFQN